MNNGKGFANVILIVLAVVLAGVLGYIALVKKSAPAMEPVLPVAPPQSLPTSCVDIQEGAPVITSFSKFSGSIGDTIEIHGCNFSGFEGDKIAVIKNSQDVSAPIAGGSGSTSKLLKITLRSPLCMQDISYSGLPCPSYLTLASGVYKIYTAPWGKKSNEVSFTIR